MTNVQRLLQHKGHTVWSIAPDASVFEAVQLMAEKGVGALMVVDRNELVGVISERDYAREIVLKDRVSRDTPVGAIMTHRVLYVRPQQTLEECMALMTEKNLRHLPVLDDRRLVGVISMRDVVKELIAEKEFLIEQLENYITDRR
ncbi:MAG TPA: CBS domain-containing protein [Roseiflexaceae bacterium]|nr:CBS domain-containing protein [Roseiflexaceae bacterium]